VAPAHCLTQPTDVPANALPDIISWHELGGPSTIAADVAACVALERSLGITLRPISIEEYATTSEINDPGALVPYLAAFERNGVANAKRAFWYEYGTVDGLVTVSGHTQVARSPAPAFAVVACLGTARAGAETVRSRSPRSPAGCRDCPRRTRQRCTGPVRHTTPIPSRLPRPR